MALYDYEEPEFPETAQHKLIMLAGPSGAGKTTWRKEFMKFHQDEDWRVINGDDVRLQYIAETGISYHDSHQSHHARIIGQRFNQLLEEAVKDGANVIVDAINARLEGRQDLLQRIDGYVKLHHPDEGRFYDQRALVGFLVTKEEALQRNAIRDQQRAEKGWPTFDIPEERVGKFVDEFNAQLPTPTSHEDFTQYVYHFSSGYKQASPSIVRALDEAVQKARSQTQLG